MSAGSPSPSVVSSEPGGSPPEDPVSIQQAYEQHFEFVWRSLRRLGVPEGMAEDAVQEVFLVAHRKLPEFRGNSSLRTWLFAIAVRIARKTRAAAPRECDHADEEPAATAPDPDESLVMAQARETLHAILSELAESRRIVFILVELEELSAPEVAGMLDCPVNTVYSRLRLARQDFNASVARYRARGRWRCP